MSDPFSPLERSFAARGRLAGGTLILPPDAAIDLVNAARAAGSVVLGVDSFVLDGKDVYPQIDHILDLSVCGPPFDCWDEAIRFVLARSDRGFAFEVVIANSTPATRPS